jgi:hypothetical protein
MAAAYEELRAQLNKVNKLRVIDAASNYNDSNDSPPSLLPGELKQLKIARQRCKETRKGLMVRKFNKFLDDIERVTSSVGEKVQSAFKFIKSSQRSAVRNSSPVTVDDWRKDLETLAGPSPPLIPETDGISVGAAPTLAEIFDILSSMKNSKSPGQDKLYVEMLKASPYLTAKLKRIIRVVYITNEVPRAWQNTTTIPIPKIKKPQTVDDYCKITLCSTGCKIYVKSLMSRLHKFVPPNQDYQAGFVSNKSCNDHLFTVKRVLEDPWIKGLPTYVCSLDLRKAFDRVDIHQLPRILSERGVPHYLINRIIASCFTETNSIKWFGHWRA